MPYNDGMEEDIEDLVREAWERVKPTLERDGEELKRRLARREGRGMGRPPRAWCLALRAMDLRLDEAAESQPGTPALSQREWEKVRRVPREGQRDEVVMTTEKLRRLCSPVRLEAPGEPLSDVAKKLGARPSNLDYARLKGVFQT